MNPLRAQPQGQHQAGAVPAQLAAASAHDSPASPEPLPQRPKAAPQAWALLCPFQRDGSLCFALQEKRQSPSAHAGPCCCTGHGCPRNVIQLLGHNRAMLRLSPQPSAEAQSQESSRRDHLEEEETPRLPSALTLQLQYSALHPEHCRAV